ncbi:MAG: hypothetical protein JXX28_00415 [Deltaproteobacteria bacterium]|nr:hypothetical protein [Deltaproteobacteria bacterium]
MKTPLIALALTLAACNGAKDTTDTSDPVGELWRGAHTHTLLMGQADNAEVIKVVPGQRRAILVSSKARKLTLLDVGASELSVVREAVLFADDPTESELTHVDIAPDGSWAAVTRTLIVKDGEGAQTDCGGEVVFVDASDSESFGAVLSSVEVGPMPDYLDISDDGAKVAVAAERDGPDAWGKCEVPGEVPSISVLDVSGGPASATEVTRVTMIDGDTGPREPEAVVISPDGDLVVATLQDSNEVAMFSCAAVVGEATSDSVDIVHLPTNALGAEAWPDGVTSFRDLDSSVFFVTAGEWNDTFQVLSFTGEVVSNTDISASDIPAGFPRVVSEGYPLFEPDSVSTFSFGGHSHVAMTLRQAGAVAVYDVSDATAPSYVTAIQVGADETGGQDEDGSVIRPEGIAAASDGSFIVVANEGESSVSLITRVE